MGKKKRGNATKPVKRKSAERPAAPPSQLPGAGQEDPEVIDRAVSDLNQIWTTRGLQMACDLARYVLDTFFDGDPANFREKANGHASFRALAGRDDLLVSYSHLCTAVGVYEQCEQLPDDVAQSLPVSHHRALLPIKDAETKERLAREAAEQRLTVGQVTQKVRDTRQRNTRAGRPPLPPAVKTLHRLEKLLEDDGEDPVPEDALSRYDPETAEQLAQRIDRTMEQLETAREKLRTKTGSQRK